MSAARPGIVPSGCDRDPARPGRVRACARCAPVADPLGRHTADRGGLADRRIPTVISGFLAAGRDIHAPNENLPARYIPLGIEAARALFTELGQL